MLQRYYNEVEQELNVTSLSIGFLFSLVSISDSFFAILRCFISNPVSFIATKSSGKK